MKKKIVVVGSTNMDMVVKTAHIPAPGETVLGGTFFMSAGGKGANQAVAVARLGGDVVFISKIGKDLFGKQSCELFEKEGMDISHILYDENLPSGIALITVDDKGENSIVVAPGSNANLLPKDIEQSVSIIEGAAIILMQLETPMDSVSFVATIASKKYAKVILNPAPAASLPKELLKHIDLITPNENEASLLSGVDVTDLETAKKAAIVIHQLGVKDVIITMGSLGALVYSNDGFNLIQTTRVKAIDTTAAGDVFNGAIAVALAEEKDLLSAVIFACEAATISVTRLGAQASIPYRKELIG